jgi:phage recombination protein Bet
MTTEALMTAATYATGWAPPVWDAERVALVKKAIAPPTATQADVEFFIAWCKRTQLDPFVKQAYFVERKSKDAQGNWHTRHEPMAAEAGMAARADVEADFMGVRSSAVYAGDTFEVDAENGQVTHKWNLESRAKAGNRLLGAWAHARRKGRDVPIVWLTVEQRIQTRPDYNDRNKQVPTQFWQKDAAGMITKCARAMAYRLAFPNLFSGVFIREELEADETTGGPAAPGPSGPPVTVDSSAVSRLASKLGVVLPEMKTAEPVPVEPVMDAGGKVGASTPEPGWPRASPPVPDAPPDVTPSGETTAAPPKEEEPDPDGPILPFGKRKGELIASLSTVTLEEAVQEARAKVAKAKGTETWLQHAKNGITQVEEEISRRAKEEIPFP